MQRLEPERDTVIFHTASGRLTVNRTDAGYVMDFPTRPPEPLPTPPGLTEALGVVPLEVLSDTFNYIALLENAQLVRGLAPDIPAIARLDRSGVVVTAPGDEGYDFVSRYFAPAKGIAEDPVTGGAHCALVPYWAKRIGKTAFRAYQASPRGGEIVCRLADDRVELEGSCVFYLEGTVEIEIVSCTWDGKDVTPPCSRLPAGGVGPDSARHGRVETGASHSEAATAPHDRPLNLFSKCMTPSSDLEITSTSS
jgi:predicted PhzF superfamily epimerase YddE/YHI9